MGTSARCKAVMLDYLPQPDVIATLCAGDREDDRELPEIRDQLGAARARHEQLADAGGGGTWSRRRAAMGHHADQHPPRDRLPAAHPRVDRPTPPANLPDPDANRTPAHECTQWCGADDIKKSLPGAQRGFLPRSHTSTQTRAPGTVHAFDTPQRVTCTVPVSAPVRMYVRVACFRTNLRSARRPTLPPSAPPGSNH